STSCATEREATPRSSTKPGATSSPTGSNSAARRWSAFPTSASPRRCARGATTSCSSALTATRASSRWSSAARPSTCCGTARRPCSSSARRGTQNPRRGGGKGRRPGSRVLAPRAASGSAAGAAVLAGRHFGGGLAVAPHAEAGDAGFERLQAPLDAAHLLLDGGQRRHPVERAPEAFVDEPLQLPETVGDLRQLLDAPPGPLGRRAKRFDTPVDGRGQVLERRLAVADDVAQNGKRQETALSPLLLEDDLREGDRRQIITAVVLEDLHLLARLHPAPDLLESDVTTLAGIVELPIPVPLYEPPG